MSQVQPPLLVIRPLACATRFYLLIFSSKIAATADQGTATFVATWVEAGLQRYRFYTDVQDMNSFVHAFQNCGGITNNWQAWQQDGHGVFDDSEVLGEAGELVIGCGIKEVTGQDCHQINNFGCLGG